MDLELQAKGSMEMQAWSHLQLGINEQHVLGFVYWFRPFGAHNLSHILYIVLFEMLSLSVDLKTFINIMV